MVLPVSDHMRYPGEDNISENLPRPQDILRGNLYGEMKVKPQQNMLSTFHTGNDPT